MNKMAQHYEVDLTKEPKVRASIQRIGKYIARFSFLRNKKDFEKRTIYRKEVMFLSDQYKMKDNDDFIVGISPYNLPNHKEEFGEYWKNADLEAHFDRGGNITVVYYPL